MRNLPVIKGVPGKIMISLALMALMTIASLSGIVTAADDEPETTGFDVKSLQPGQRQGIHDLDEKPAEYRVDGPTMSYSQALVTLDINGDGYSLTASGFTFSGHIS